MVLVASVTLNMIEYWELAASVMLVGGVSVIQLLVNPALMLAVTSVPAMPLVPGAPALTQASTVAPFVEPWKKTSM